MDNYRVGIRFHAPVWGAVLILLAFLLSMSLASVPAPLHAYGSLVLVVNSTADPGDGPCDAVECTLREAVLAANASPGPDEIIVPAGVYTLSHQGAGENRAQTGDLDITDDVVIRGDGAATTIIDANEIDRVFHVLANVEAKLKGITIQHGFAGDGGGILNGGKLTLVDSIIAHNRVNYEAPEEGANRGGGIYNAGMVNMTGSSMIENMTDQDMGDGPGGAIFNVSILIVTHSDFHHNWAAAGGAIFNDGGQVTLTTCNLDTNWARFFGGALENADRGHVSIDRCTITGNNESISNWGGGLLLLSNSTVSHNLAYRTNGGVINWDGTVKIIHSTISYNGTQGSAAGGIAGPVILSRSIVAHNDGGDCATAVVSRGYNLDSDGSCGLTHTGDMTADPLLAPLQNNGGPTLTHALLPGSPAIDALPAGACSLPVDQRGVSRPQDGNGDGVPACDIGAFELAD